MPRKAKQKPSSYYRCCPICKGKLPSGVSLIQLPKDSSLRAKWIEILSWDPLNIIRHPTICSLHFHPSQLQTREGKVHLVDKTAVPRLEPYDQFDQNSYMEALMEAKRIEEREKRIEAMNRQRHLQNVFDNYIRDFAEFKQNFRWRVDEEIWKVREEENLIAITHFSFDPETEELVKDRIIKINSNLDLMAKNRKIMADGSHKSKKNVNETSFRLAKWSDFENLLRIDEEDEKNDPQERPLDSTCNKITTIDDTDITSIKNEIL